jgi:flagellar hook-length control protein FliK
VEPVDAARPEGLEPVPAGDRRERPALPDRVEGPDPVALADRVERPDRVEQPDRVERADRVEGPDPVAAGSLQPQGPPALRPAAAPTAPAGTAPVAPRPAPVVEQLVDRLGELTATRADGDHEVTVQLDPAELGRVELRVRLHDDRVHVHLGAEERGTADLVRQHLPELRSALEAAGIATGGLDVGDHPGHRPPASDPRPDPSAPDHDPARVAARPTPAVPAPSAAAIPAAGGLDLLL